MIQQEANIADYQIKQRLALSFEAKVLWARNRIREWYNHYAGMVYVAFSGGKDSQVLLHIVRSMYPEVPAVFCQEPTFPEVLDVVRQTQNVVTLKPKQQMPAIIERYGYPVISKEVSRYVHEARSAGPESATWRLRTTGMTSAGKFSKRSRMPKCWHKLLSAPFLVSDHCCSINKKYPSAIYQKQSGRMPFTGTTITESNQRMLAYKRFGCNGFGMSSPRSQPISIWTTSDVWQYIDVHRIKVAEVYHMGYGRTGCMICGFGCHMRCPNQFELLHETHPKVWRWGMDKIGWRVVLNWLRIRCGDEVRQLEMFAGS